MAEDKKIREVANSLTAALSKVDLSHEADFIDSVIDVVVTPPKKIPEPVFREIFLPYFIGEKKSTPDENAVAHWIGLVGSATEAADVVDVRGEVIFKVPPMLDSARIKTGPGTKNVNLTSVFSVYEDDSKVHTNRARYELAQKLAEKSVAMAQDNPNAVTWEGALRHYKLMPEQIEAKKPLNNNTDDDLVFGDD